MKTFQNICILIMIATVLIFLAVAIERWTKWDFMFGAGWIAYQVYENTKIK